MKIPLPEGVSFVIVICKFWGVWTISNKADLEYISHSAFLIILKKS